MAQLAFPRSSGVPLLHRHRPLSPSVVALIYLTLGVFYAASIHQGGLERILYVVKWVPITLLFLVCIHLTARQENTPFPGMLAVLLVCLGVSVAEADNVARGAEYYLSVALVLCAAWYLARLLNSDARRLAFLGIVENIGKLVLASAALCFVLGINLGRGGVRFSAWTDNPNTLGILLAPACVIWIGRTLRPGRRVPKLDAALAVGALLLIAETGSRASILWVITASLVFLLARRGMSIGLLFAAIAILVLATLPDEPKRLMLEYLKYRDHAHSATFQAPLLSGRDELWRLGFSLWRRRPLFGYGLGSAEGLINQNASLLRNSQGGHFHNSFLSALVENGLLGLGALVAVIYSSLSQTGRRLLALSGSPKISVVWMTHVLPMALVVGALAHALFETWLLNGGNQNMLLLWTLIWLVAMQGRERLLFAEPRFRAAPLATRAVGTRRRVG